MRLVIPGTDERRRAAVPVQELLILLFSEVWGSSTLNLAPRSHLLRLQSSTGACPAPLVEGQSVQPNFTHCCRIGRKQKTTMASVK